MIKINPRRPFYDDQPEGYLESDKDFLLNNFEAAIELLERELAAQQCVQSDRACAWCKMAADPNNASVTACPFHDTPRR